MALPGLQQYAEWRFACVFDHTGNPRETDRDVVGFCMAQGVREPGQIQAAIHEAYEGSITRDYWPSPANIQAAQEQVIAAVQAGNDPFFTSSACPSQIIAAAASAGASAGRVIKAGAPLE